MSLLHPGLLALLGLAAVPVVLHFLLKPKPKKFPFPALRLIRDRRKSNSRRLKLRHLWLLLLRILAIVLLVLAVVRPSLPAANYSFTTGEWVTLGLVIAAILVAYQVVLSRWRSQQRRGDLARHDLLYRRTLLRAGSTAGAFLLAALLVLWPYGRRVAAEVRAPVQAVTEDQPVAAVFLFDTSSSMGLVRAGENRLEAALALAAEHADSFPPGSKLAVMTTAPGEAPRFAADLFGAKTRMQQLEVNPVTVPMDGRIAAAVDLHERDREQVAAELGLGESTAEDAGEADAFVRAVYVFTDLARSAWGPGGRPELANKLATRERVQAFLVDVGVEGPENVAVGVPRPSRQSGPVGGTVTVRAAVSRAPLRADPETGEVLDDRGPAPFEVELRTGSVGESPVARGRQTVTLPPGGGAEVSFSVPIAAAGAVEGELALTGSDPLAFDDRRPFTIRAESPLRVAVASDRLADARAFGEALSPSLTPEERKPAVVTAVRTGDLAALETASFDVIYLLNARAPDAAATAKLGAFAEAGGGVGVVLGADADVLAYNVGPAAEWMPAELVGPLGFGVPERMVVTDPNHPVFAPFDPLGGTGALESRDVRRYFVVEPKDEVAVPAVLTDPQKRPPALLTWGVGAGRVAVVTTALIVDKADWSDLPDAGWSYLAFVKFLTRHLSGRSEQRFNFLAADTLVVPVTGPTAGDGDGGGADVAAVLRRPDLSQTRLTIPAGAGEVAVTGADAPGRYSIARPPARDGGGGELLSAFSVNLPEPESDLTVISTDDLDARLGEGRYTLSRTAEELDLTTVRGRLGEEMFPYLLALLMAVFAGELIVGNRFYESEQATAAATSPRTAGVPAAASGG